MSNYSDSLAVEAMTYLPRAALTSFVINLMFA